jgi:phosphoribosylanthranilate isomerase
MFVKVCGLSTKEQIDKAIEYGYDAIGVVTWPKSRRYCPPEHAIKLAEHAKGKIKSFIVGLRYSDVEAAAPAFDYVQIYEIRRIANLVLASKEMPPAGVDFRYFVYDASVGGGVFAPFPEWLREMTGKLVIAGGLNRENVCAVIRDIKPFGVDVSSGVEKNGIKDFELMKDFINAVRICVEDFLAT